LNIGRNWAYSLIRYSAPSFSPDRLRLQLLVQQGIFSASQPKSRPYSCQSVTPVLPMNPHLERRDILLDYSFRGNQAHMTFGAFIGICASATPTGCPCLICATSISVLRCNLYSCASAAELEVADAVLRKPERRGVTNAPSWAYFGVTTRERSAVIFQLNLCINLQRFCHGSNCRFVLLYFLRTSWLKQGAKIAVLLLLPLAAGLFPQNGC